MEKTREELLEELQAMKLKHANLEHKYNKDVAGYKKKQEEMRMRLMFLEGIANSTIDGYIVVDPYGQKILQNQQTVDLWKIPQEIADDPSGIKQVEHVMHMTVNPEQFLSEINYLREHPNDKSRDELVLIDGTVLDRYSSPVIGSDGTNYGRIWTFHDVTELKKIEGQLYQLNKQKDRFISILAHDLKSPFSSILGFIQILKRKIRSYPVEKNEEILDALDIAAQKTYNLLEDTLLWASVQSKKLTFNPEKKVITEIVDEVVDVLNQVAYAKNISIKNNTSPHLIANIDAYMIKAVVRNLVSNAIKFTNTGGEITIRAIAKKTNTTICISDNGVGIEPEILSQIFNISSKHSTVGTANESGTGLGLILCKEFVNKHKGEIWIDSMVNKGTTVYFSVPN